MISFSNLPLADVQEYFGKYGIYIIALKKQWKMASLPSSVWYRDKQSQTLQNIMDIFEETDYIFNSEFNKREQTLIWDQIAYTKNFEGPLMRRKINCYRFYDEKEFRFVPSPNDLQKRYYAHVKGE